MALRMRTLCAVLTGVLGVFSISASANANDVQRFNEAIDRPDWLPKLPTVPNYGFTSNSLEYERLYKEIFEKNNAKAIAEMDKLARGGHARSLNTIGYLYDGNSKLVKKNTRISSQYFAASAKLGYEPAIHNLGVLYYYGDGVPQDLATAKRLFEIASSQGIQNSNYLLGRMHEAQKNYPSAIFAYQKCLNYRSLPKCKTRHSVLSITTRRLSPQDSSKVVRNLSNASYYGDLEASYTLARLYAEGIIVAKDLKSMVQSLEEMRIGPNSNDAQRKLVQQMYDAYKPTEYQINEGRKTYRRVTASGQLTNSAKFKPQNDRETILNKSNVYDR